MDNCSSLPMTNLQGRPDRGNTPLPVACLVQHFAAKWFVNEFGISAVVTSKMVDIVAFEAHFPCARDAEQREAPVGQLWLRSAGDEKGTKAIDVLNELWSG